MSFKLSISIALSTTLAFMLGVLHQSLAADVSTATAAEPVAAGDIPRLVEALDDDAAEGRQQAVASLSALGQPAIASLVAAAKDPRPHVCRGAVAALAGVEDRRAVESLLGAMRSEDAAVRWAAASALGRVVDPAAFQPLLAALADANWNVRQKAAEAIAALGDARAVQPLTKLLNDREWRVRRAAVKALHRLKQPEAVPRLVQAVKDEEAEVRRSLAAALGQYDNDQSVTALVALLADKDGSVRVAAAQALGKLHRPASIAPLTKALSDADPAIRYAAVRALTKIGRPAVGAIVEILNGEDAKAHGPAVLALGDIDDAESAAALVKALDSQEAKVRAWAALALGRLGAKGVPAASKLLELLSDGAEAPNPTGAMGTVGGAAAVALGAMTADNEGMLVEQLRQGESVEQANAAAGLAAAALNRPLKPKTVGSLRRALRRSDDPWVRYFAAAALGAVADHTVARVLLLALLDEESRVRHTAAWGLGRMATTEAKRAAAWIEIASQPPRGRPEPVKPARQPNAVENARVVKLPGIQRLADLLREEIPLGTVDEITFNSSATPRPIGSDWTAERLEFYRRQQQAMLALAGCVQEHSDESGSPAWLEPLIGRAMFHRVAYLWASRAASDRHLSMIGSLSELTRLRLLSEGISDDGMAALSSLSELRELDLPYSKLSRRGISHIVGLPKLQSLHVSESGAAADEVLLAVRDMTGLRSLTLGYGVTDQGLANLRKLTRLERLSFQGSEVSDEGLAQLKELTALVELNLPDVRVTDVGMANFAKMTKLEHFEIRGQQVTDAGVAHLQAMTGLKVLRLYNVPLTDAGLTRLKDLINLEELWLGPTLVTDAGLANLAGMKKLRTLYLQSDNVTDAGLKHLGGLIELKTLTLRFRQVTDAGLAHLHPLQKLEFLSLVGTQVTPVAVARLREALPKTRISWEPN